jgi:pimeloyl-ACP methyl ester carboxylesterase
MNWRILGWLTLLMTACVLPGKVYPQAARYADAPQATPPYYRVRYEATPAGQGLEFGVQYTLWVPPEVQTLRGVLVHQHGCGEGSCRSGLTGAYDLHWQALARKHHLALMSPVYEQPEGADCQKWCDPRNGSDETFRRSLKDLADLTSHPELEDVPWVLWGHSGGGHWAGGMLMLHPKRIVAAWLRSGVPLLADDRSKPMIRPHVWPQEAIEVPIVCNLGTREGVTVQEERFAAVWPANELFFRTTRAKGALVAIAVDPLSSHDCGNQRYLAIAWLDACLQARLPDNPEQPLLSMPRDAAWLANIPDGQTVPLDAMPQDQFPGNPLEASWIPNESIAKAWAEYQKDGGVGDRTPPPAPHKVTVTPEGLLSWDCDADLESGLSHMILLRQGKPIAEVRAAGNHPFGRQVLQGLQYSDTPTLPLTPMTYAIPDFSAGTEEQYQIIAVNTAGLQSAATTALPRASQ